MKPRDRELGRRLSAELHSFDRTKRPLFGIRDPSASSVFLEQLLESTHRVRLFEVLRARDLSDRRADPNDDIFDPQKAAILCQRRGHIDEGFWLVFLSVHFGKHRRAEWRYVREVYGRLGGAARWDWAATSADPTAFRAWLDAHQAELQREGVPRGFGNHRKYESLDAYSANGTGAVVDSYVHWVNPPRTHQDLVEEALRGAEGDPGKAFDHLYCSMRSVVRFGRTARFDFLTMLAKVGLAALEPPSPYLEGSTGPVRGARLLFGVNEGAATLDQWLVELDADLKVGMQVLEDALCNWQKSPMSFKPFRG